MNAYSLYSVARWFYVKKIPVIPTVIRNIIFLLYNSYIPPSAVIGKGTVFAYGAIGVVLHSNCTIGQRCVIGQGVTIGASEGYLSTTTHCSPKLGNNCYLGAGSKIIGNISIGNSCIIGAGAVVLSNVPDHSVLVGCPARIVSVTEPDYMAIRN